VAGHDHRDRLRDRGQRFAEGHRRPGRCRVDARLGALVDRVPPWPALPNQGQELLATLAAQQEELKGVMVELVGDEVAERRGVLAGLSPIRTRAIGAKVAGSREQLDVDARRVLD